MPTFEYVGDGLGSIQGVGVVYPGVVVDSDAVGRDAEGKPLVDLSSDPRFAPASAAATAVEAVAAVMGKHNEESVTHTDPAPEPPVEQAAAPTAPSPIAFAPVVATPAQDAPTSATEA